MNYEGHIEAQLADHNARIQACEAEINSTKGRLDWLMRLMITTLIAAVGGLVAQLVKH